MNTHHGYRIVKVVMPDAERLPVLLDPTGMPVFHVLAYTLTHIRVKNRSSSTIEVILRSLLILYIFLDDYDINLRDRLDKGELLSLFELEMLLQFCRHPIVSMKAFRKLQGNKIKKNISNAELFRQSPSARETETVDPTHAATRVRYIRDYLLSLIMKAAYRRSLDSLSRNKLIELSSFTNQSINSRIPIGDNRGKLNVREGLSSEDSLELLRVINPQSVDNPWHDAHTKARNELLILWLYYLGLRRGEALTICISDIFFQERSVVIPRRADNPKDPRINQPLTKTKARKIPLEESLIQKTEDYIMRWRIQLPVARKHEFLFVAANGAPLSISGFTKIFITLRKKCPQLSQDLFAHILRHSWNDRFSALVDEKGIGEAEEAKIRSYIMGWSENSDTAANYTKRHIRRKANQISLQLQKRFHNK